MPVPTAPVTAAATASTPPPEPTPPPAVQVWKDMATPESVLYDAANDRYLVSNINGKPLDADNNGFISELSPDGKVTKLKLVEGGGKVTLNAPKGMVIVKGVLYVSDIDTVRAFDAKTGAPKGSTKIAGATFLNDVTAGPDGTVYVTDSGLKAGTSDFEPTGTDAIWSVTGGKAKLVAKSTELNRPNGILWTDKGLLVSTFGAAEVYLVDPKWSDLQTATAAQFKKGQTPPPPPPLKQSLSKTPKGGLDGVVDTGAGILVSSWAEKGIYKGTVGGAFELAMSGLTAPADIGFDSKRKLVLVPHFMENKVVAYAVK
jgi:sugar lactone lactonase YvrE